MSSDHPDGSESPPSTPRQVEKRILILYLIGLALLVLSYLIPLPYSVLPLVAAVVLFVRGWLLGRRLRRNRTAPGQALFNSRSEGLPSSSALSQSWFRCLSSCTIFLLSGNSGSSCLLEASAHHHNQPLLQFRTRYGRTASGPPSPVHAVVYLFEVLRHPYPNLRFDPPQPRS